MVGNDHIDEKDWKYLINLITRHYANYTPEEYLEDEIEMLNELYSKYSFKLYRILWIDDVEKINDKCGIHYVDDISFFNEQMIDNLYDLMSSGRTPGFEKYQKYDRYDDAYLITVNANLSQVDWAGSLIARIEYPDEREITTKSCNMKIVSIEKFYD